MSYSPENSLDPEFDVLPAEERWDANKLKEWHGIRTERAVRQRRIRNGVGAAALLVAGGLGIARLTGAFELPEEVAIPVAVAEGLAIGVASSSHRRARQEDADAARNAEIVAGMFDRAQLEPPAWTQPVPQHPEI